MYTIFELISTLAGIARSNLRSAYIQCMGGSRGGQGGEGPSPGQTQVARGFLGSTK